MGWRTLLVSLLALWQAAHARCPGLSCGCEIAIEEEPFMASLQRVAEGHVCSATLLSTSWLLTAAQCLVDKDGRPRATSNYFVLMGSTSVAKHATLKDGVRGWPDRFVVHPMFSTKDSIDYDLGMMRLQSPVEPSRRISLVSLPKDVIPNHVLQSRNCSVIGWSRKQDLRTGRRAWTLTSVELQLWDPADCADQSHRSLRDHVHLCTYCRCTNMCHGGSGSALICQGVQVGVVSFLVGCPGPYKAVYARLDTQLPWLLQVVSSSSGTCSDLPWPCLLLCAANAAICWLTAVSLAAP